MELSGKRVMVVGLGVSGLAVAEFLASRGAKLVMTDRRIDIDRTKLPEGDLRLGNEAASWLSGVDLVVTSPGIPRNSVLLQGAVKRQIPVIGEIELASRFYDRPVAAVTGTNGKSTVVILLGQILIAAGRVPFVGGNLGTPFIRADSHICDVAVVEVSSFQLEWIDKFKPNVGVHLNLTDDHFDRYRDLEEYGRAKARLFENQDRWDYAILNREDPNVWKLAGKVRSRAVGFGLADDSDEQSIWFDKATNEIGYNFGPDWEPHGRISLEGFRLRGRHNVCNAMAAAGAALALGVNHEVIEQVLAEFHGLPHRIEVIHRKGGVTYIDDSKGTNVGAVVEAIDALAPPIILIAGGLDKGGDYAPLRRPLGEKVKLAILNGASREKMGAALHSATKIESVATLKEAVEHAARAARPGDTVLLSPACSSFDQFKDYAERGNVYQELVRAL